MAEIERIEEATRGGIKFHEADQSFNQSPVKKFSGIRTSSLDKKSLLLTKTAEFDGNAKESLLTPK